MSVHDRGMRLERAHGVLQAGKHQIPLYGLCDIGFIYSFTVVAGLIVLCPILVRPVHRLCEPDPLRLQPEKPWVAWLRGLGKHTASLVAVSCSAWLVSAPLTAYFFGRFCPVALLSNLVVVPLAFLIVLSGCLSITFGPCIGYVADIFNHAGLALTTALVSTMDAISQIPFATVSLGNMPAWAIASWYAALAGIALLAAKRPGKSRT